MQPAKRFLTCLSAAVTLLGCGATTPTVPTGPHPAPVSGGRLNVVPYPPPPANVEIVPLRRRDTCLWLDGSWDFRGHSWEWTKGAWVDEKPECFYAPPETRFQATPTGTALVYRPGAWFETDAPEKPCPPPPACAETSEAEAAALP